MSNRKIKFNPLQIIRYKSERTLYLICTAIALVFWIGLKMDIEYDKIIKVPIEFVPANDKMTLIKDAPSHLAVTLNGKGGDLLMQSLRRKTPRLYFQLNYDGYQDFLDQDFRGQLNPQLRDGITIKNLLPGVVHLDLDTKIRKKIPVEFRQNFNIASQYIQIGEVNLQPENITITGPASLVNQIKSWQTNVLQIENMNKRLRDTIGLKPHKNGQISCHPNYVTYDIIVEQFTEKELIVPIRIMGDASNIKIYPNEIKVKCNVALSFYNKLKAENFQIIVNANNLTTEKAPIFIQTKPTYIKDEDIKLELDAVEYIRFEPANASEN